MNKYICINKQIIKYKIIDICFNMFSNRMKTLGNIP